MKTVAGDPFSWWSVNADGDEVVTRINYLGRHSQVLQDFSHDPRLLRFARLAGPHLRVCDDRLDGPMVFIKHSNVVKGNGDLSWHVDDGIGGHPVMCPLIQTGIQLDHANPTNGQLLVLAGSHRYTKHWIAWGEEHDLPTVALETEPGDLTVHYGDTMHTTPPPAADGAGRRALYYKFAEPKTFEWIPADCHYNDALFRSDTGGRRRKPRDHLGDHRVLNSRVLAQARSRISRPSNAITESCQVTFLAQSCALAQSAYVPTHRTFNERDESSTRSGRVRLLGAYAERSCRKVATLREQRRAVLDEELAGVGRARRATSSPRTPATGVRPPSMCG